VPPTQHALQTCCFDRNCPRMTAPPFFRGDSVRPKSHLSGSKWSKTRFDGAVGDFRVKTEFSVPHTLEGARQLFLTYFVQIRRREVDLGLGSYLGRGRSGTPPGRSSKMKCHFTMKKQPFRDFLCQFLGQNQDPPCSTHQPRVMSPHVWRGAALPSSNPARARVKVWRRA